MKLSDLTKNAICNAAINAFDDAGILNEFVTRRRDISRKQHVYSEDTYNEKFAFMQKLSDFCGSGYVLKTIIDKEYEDEKLIQLFTYDMCCFLDDYTYWFSSIEKCPSRYRKVVFNAFFNGGCVHYEDKNERLKFFMNSVVYARKHRYSKFLKFLSQFVTAIIRNKRREFNIDGRVSGKYLPKESREERAVARRDYYEKNPVKVLPIK